MQTETEFQWTDALVREYALWSDNEPIPVGGGIERFKESKKHKEWSMVTADGINIKGGDFYHVVNKTTFRMQRDIIANKETGIFESEGRLIFAREDYAWAYILDNKPVFSLNDIQRIWQELFPIGSPMHNQLTIALLKETEQRIQTK